MRRALVLNAVDPRIGGVLIRGERGTAKSTAARALAALLPKVAWCADCRFGCDPDLPATWCTECQERSAQRRRADATVRADPFINLPVSATEDRVVGTLDIEAAIQKGERHFEPGVLAAANRGLLYIDEVNLLDDHVVDVLLDAAAMGMNIVEREGISFSHPARFILVGTMNPEEGDLRPQLLDRFALSVEIYGIRDARERVRLWSATWPSKPTRRPSASLAPSEQELSQQIARARKLVEQVTYTSRDLLSIASLTASLGVDGHRPDLVILKAARAQAAFEGRTRITERDIALAAELALPHRLKHTPFQQSGGHGRAGRAHRAAAGAEQSEGQRAEEEEPPKSAPLKKKSR
jgi:Mg-chelatase subunit ChlI